LAGDGIAGAQDRDEYKEVLLFVWPSIG
jgi:hypothetical protein